MHQIEKQRKISFSSLVCFKISNQLYETFVEEEERFQTEVQQIFSTLKEKFQEKNQRLSKKFYQLFKEQTMINCDDVSRSVSSLLLQ